LISNSNGRRAAFYHPAGSDGISVFDAADKQLGLKVELQKAPGPVVVVDSVNRKPTDNLPTVAQALPITRPEFEAVDVKLSAPETKEISYGLPPVADGTPPDLFETRLVLPTIFPGNLRADLMVVPKWIETYHIDVVAKAPTSGPASASGDVVVPVDQLRTMLHCDRWSTRSWWIALS
jgi:hypothetical protein